MYSVHVHEQMYLHMFDTYKMVLPVLEKCAIMIEKLHSSFVRSQSNKLHGKTAVQIHVRTMAQLTPLTIPTITKLTILIPIPQVQSNLTHYGTG